MLHRSPTRQQSPSTREEEREEEREEGGQKGGATEEKGREQ